MTTHLESEVERLKTALRFYADRRNHNGAGSSRVYNDRGRTARLAVGACPTCNRHGDSQGSVKTGRQVCDQDGCDDEYGRCPDCKGGGYEGATW